MPPGTGDTQLTFSQEIKMDGAIIVSTPQEVALLDVKRRIKMFDFLKQFRFRYVFIPISLHIVILI